MPARRGVPMITSRDRILTTHVGSLPRDEVLTDLLIRREAGEAIDAHHHGGGDGPGGARHGRRAGCGRHRHRQRRRAAARRLSDLYSGAHVGLRRRIQAQGRHGFPGGARTDRDVPAPLPARAAKISNAPQAVGRGAATPTPRTSRTRSRASSAARRREAGVRGDVHDGAVARHRRHHHDECLLRLARGLPDGARARDAARIPGHPRGRAAPADRCARPGDGAHDDVPGPERRANS